jgi:uncharacterized protein YdiU (UPF0061 family)
MTIQKQAAGWKLDNSYAQLPAAFYAKLAPTPVRSAKLIFFHEQLAQSLGLDATALRTEQGVQIFAGNQLPHGSIPLAQAYAGHQFGYFTMLGDGRAILLGEQITPDGKRFDIQLKGAGETPFSRAVDGRAALGPMLREYIISEAMYHLGIPTTRSLAVVTTGEEVERETRLPGAILTRVAASHIRVGTFEYAARLRPVEELKMLADYTIARHDPDLKAEPDRYLLFLQAIIQRQASLIAKWMLVGFVHGVMNTDNMAISGETIDYGPCAFIDVYDPKTVFSSIDHDGRYAYDHQPAIAAWNLARFAEALLPLLHDNQQQAIQIAQEAIHQFQPLYQQYWLSGMRKKLGIGNEEDGDRVLVDEFLQLMDNYKADYTNTFRALTLDQLEEDEIFATPAFMQWYQKWQMRLTRQPQTENDIEQLMKKNNPSVVPRNHRVEEALEAAVNNDDYTVLNKLVQVLSNPYAYTSEQECYTEVPKTARPYITFCGT